MTGEIFISVIVPVKDEEDTIGGFLERVPPILDRVSATENGSWEILFVDDGSTDTTYQRIVQANTLDERIKCISFSRNFGKEAALSAGLSYSAGRVVVPMDVDLQDPPEVLEDMVVKWKQGAHVVYGIRRGRETDSLPKRLTADLFYKAHNRLSHDKIPEHAGDFRLLDRRVVDAINKLPERNRFMKGIFAWSGFRHDSVEYDRVERTAGTTKFGYLKLWRLAIDGIVSSSTLPLRVWSYVGFAIAVLAFFYAIFIVIRSLLVSDAPAGYPSLMVVILFLSGIQLMSLGVMGEYIGRLLVEARQRPLFIVQEHLGIDAPDQ